jgi:hypothetical protein
MRHEKTSGQFNSICLIVYREECDQNTFNKLAFIARCCGIRTIQPVNNLAGLRNLWQNKLSQMSIYQTKYKTH